MSTVKTILYAALLMPSVVFIWASDQGNMEIYTEVLQGLQKYKVGAPTDYFKKTMPGLVKGDPLSWIEYRETLSSIPYVDYDCTTPELRHFISEVVDPLVEKMAILGDPFAIDYCYAKVVRGHNLNSKSISGMLELSDFGKKLEYLRTSKKTPQYLAEQYKQMSRKYWRPDFQPTKKDLVEMCGILTMLLDFETQQLNRYFNPVYFVFSGEVGSPYLKNAECYMPQLKQKIINDFKTQSPEKYYWYQYYINVDISYPVIIEAAEHGEYRAMLQIAMMAYTGTGMYGKSDRKAAGYWLKKASERIGCPELNNLDLIVVP